MASINKVIIIGNLGRDPALRHLPSGDAITNIVVATSHRSKDRATGEPKLLVEWHRIGFFGRLAEIVSQHLRKGSLVYIEGRLQTHKYTDKDAIERYATEIIAENMQMLGAPRLGMAPLPDGQVGGPQPAFEVTQHRTSREPIANAADSFVEDEIPF